nr:crosslink repair DNA glycosylase YcaQ family protein [Microlunatus panaciterrae]
MSRAQARRVALAAQGFGHPSHRARPGREVGPRDVQAVTSRLGQFQIDSINVVTRAHFVPLYSRLGPYDPALLERAAHRRPRRLFEYWGHAASLIDVNLQPLLRFRMQAGFRDVWPRVEAVAREQPWLVDWVREQVAERGPVSARQLEPDPVRVRTHWGWNWSAVKTVLEWLFYTGEITSAYRNPQFERVYDLPENVLPKHVLQAPSPTPQESVRGLVRHAATALGVASELCLRDYFRTRPDLTRAAIDELVESGELVPVRVEGWDRPTYLWHRAAVPRTIEAHALLCPFDSLVFERARLEKLFDFFYRIEIYVPEPKRVHGYYVYPLLFGDRFVARTDLKADRTAGVLRVQSAWAEQGTGLSPAVTAEVLATELATLARWLGLGSIVVSPRGDLAEPLQAAVAGG